MHRDFAQRFAAAGAGHAFAAPQFETRAVHGADQQAFAAAQELAGRPIQPTSGVRADIQPSPYLARRVTMNDQRFGIALHHRLDLVQAVGGQGVEVQQHGCGIIGPVTV